MFARIEAGLRDVFLTARPVYVGATSATGFMEMAIRNAPEGAILSLVNGGFSERFAKVAEACGRDASSASSCRGARRSTSTSSNRALAAKQFAAVTVAHSETSTGVITDVRAVAELAHGTARSCIVDSVSGAGGAELTVDAWGLDFVLTGSQKALALPAGLAFAVASAELRRAREARAESRLLLRRRCSTRHYAAEESDAEHAGDVAAVCARGADGRHRPRRHRTTLGAPHRDARRDDRVGERRCRSAAASSSASSRRRARARRR